ncbi:receptor-type tyrosine-protein phosphatase S-like isoform X1 [Lates japonicus]|uniref:Receptor-type tyrosine-protein phosphatase S-like isoform X1 n=1 Tax=Lates japonicus TaxID=270547 RepID=A0AAD3R7M5_LATJO|nr:receptor-type tyrosine-protein phosphatase S-like isoform X1 [Lates japonicus]
MEEDDSTQYELILGGLKAETVYSVSVAAYTTKGDGAHSKAKLVQTPGIGRAGLRPRTPSPTSGSASHLRSLTVDFTRTLVELNEATKEVEYNRQKMEVDARLRKAVIPNLQADTSYDFKITAPEGNMGGLRHRITAKTSPPITIRPRRLHQTETTVTNPAIAGDS